MREIINLSETIRNIFLNGASTILSLLQSDVKDILPGFVSNIIEGIAMLLPGDSAEEYVKAVFDNSLLEFMFGSGLSIFVVLVVYSFFKKTVL